MPESGLEGKGGASRLRFEATAPHLAFLAVPDGAGLVRNDCVGGLAALIDGDRNATDPGGLCAECRVQTDEDCGGVSLGFIACS